MFWLSLSFPQQCRCCKDDHKSTNKGQKSRFLSFRFSPSFWGDGVVVVNCVDYFFRFRNSADTLEMAISINKRYTLRHASQQDYVAYRRSLESKKDEKKTRKGWGCSSVGRASDRHAADAGSIPRCCMGFFIQSPLSVQTLLRCPYTPVFNRMY